MLILTYNVTYWDRLGWKDTFGDSVFDQRQWEYAKAFQRKNVFTPQVIVNGEFDGVGNTPRDLQSLISKANALSTTQTVEIFCTSGGERITVSGPVNEHGVVCVIRYDDRDHDVSITHGENNGRILRHSHIVKEVTVHGWRGGCQSYSLRPLQKAGGKVAVLVHAGAGGPMIGAARIDEAGGF